MKFAEPPAAKLAIVHETVPPKPGPGSVHVKGGPLFCIFETNVIPPGMLSVSVADAAGSGPLFVMVTLYGTSEFAGDVSGPVFVTVRSADWP